MKARLNAACIYSHKGKKNSLWSDSVFHFQIQGLTYLLLCLAEWLMFSLDCFLDCDACIFFFNSQFSSVLSSSQRLQDWSPQFESKQFFTFLHITLIFSVVTLYTHWQCKSARNSLKIDFGIQQSSCGQIKSNQSWTAEVEILLLFALVFFSFFFFFWVNVISPEQYLPSILKYTFHLFDP